jgi:hypothetical protein
LLGGVLDGIFPFGTGSWFLFLHLVPLTKIGRLFKAVARAVGGNGFAG